MNGIAIGAALCFAPVAHPATSTDTFLPGAGGSVLRLALGTPLNYEQIKSERGPLIRIQAGRRAVTAPVVRWYSNGVFVTMWPGRNGPHVRFSAKYQ